MLEIVGNGSMPVTYKNNFKLQFYGATVEDCRIEVDRIYAKVLQDKTVAVYGKYTVILLYSYFDSRRHKIFKTDLNSIPFCEPVSCSLQDSLNPELLEPVAAFEPHITCERAPVNGYVWETEIEGEISVSVYSGSANEGTTESHTDDIIKQETGATVVQIDNLEIPAKQLMEMASEEINNLYGIKNEPENKQKIENESEKDNNKIKDEN